MKDVRFLMIAVLSVPSMSSQVARSRSARRLEILLCRDECNAPNDQAQERRQTVCGTRYY